MSVSLSGLTSGLPVNDIISQLMAINRQTLSKYNEQIQKTQRSKSIYNIVENQTKTLANHLKKLTAQSVLDTDLFQAKSVSTTDDKTVTASATQDAALQTFSLEVKKLATATRAQSTDASGVTKGIGQLATNSTALSAFSGVAFTSGKVTVYVNGTANEVTIDAATDTLGSVLQKINDVSPDITTATVDASGKIQIGTSGQGVVKFGGAGDTSNFFSKTRLNTTIDDASGQFLTALPLSTLNTGVDVSTAGANLATAVTAGSTFKINGVSFDTTGKSLSKVLEDINNTTSANVTASFNATDGTVTLVSKKPGAVAINLEDTTGNFLAAVGLIQSGDSLKSQKLGQNAEFSLNGTTLYSTNNTVGPEVSGINGVTLNLLAEKPGTTQTITIGRDTTQLKNTIKDFVKAFNEVTQGIADVTNAKTGSLGIDTRLTGFRNQLRGIAGSGVSGLSNYGSLGTIGISTGAAGSGGGTAPTQLVFEESKLDAALLADPVQVRTMMIGPSGILTQLKTVVDQALRVDSDNSGKQGLFQTQEVGADNKVKSLNETIARLNDRLALQEARLRKQFQVSESLISQYNAQGQALSGLSKQLSSG